MLLVFRVRSGLLKTIRSSLPGSRFELLFVKYQVSPFQVKIVFKKISGHF
jgi:hypothetical protein